MNYLPKQLGDIIFRVEKDLKSITEKNLAPYGIGIGQLKILMLFYSHPNNKFLQSEIAKKLNVNKGNISRNMKKLLEKGYLEEVSPDNKAYQLSLEGKQIKKDIMSIFMSIHHSMTEGLTEHEVKTVVAILAKISNNLKEL